VQITNNIHPASKDWAEYEKRLLKKPGVRKAMEEDALEVAIAGAVIEARIKNGLTQKDLANKLHTKQSVISRVENAKTMPSLDFLQRLADVLGYKLQVQLKP